MRQQEPQEVQQREMLKAWPRRGKTLCTWTVCGPTGWKAALQGRPYRPWWTPSWTLVRQIKSSWSSAGFPSTRDTWTYWSESRVGPQMCLRNWSICQGEAEREGTIQPGQEKAQGDLIHVYKYLVGGVKKMEPEFSQWCSVTGEEAKGTNWNTRNSM